MIELIQFPWSPFCIVQRRILEFSGVPFKITNIPNTVRTQVWKLTKQRYYQVPVLRDGPTIVFETGDDSQIIGKYLDDKFHLGLFPQEWRGVQSILWRWIENEVEGLTFKLNDIHWREFLPKAEALAFVRHKERRFGRGCLEQWQEQQGELLAKLAQVLVPFEQMLVTRPFLLDQVPRFVDFDLFGMLGNLLYSGHYELPAAHTYLRDWYGRLSTIKSQTTREKLRS